jgi:S-adenosylmethionine decarboxylase
MKTVGNHIICDAWGCPSEYLDDENLVRRAIEDAIEAGNATLINLSIHKFSPHGVTATATLAESHISIHTWPEHGYFAADAFFCGAGCPEKALDVIVNLLQPSQVDMRNIQRRFLSPQAESSRV